MSPLGIGSSKQIGRVQTPEHDNIELAKVQGVKTSSRGPVDPHQVPGDLQQTRNRAPFRMSSQLARDATKLAKGKQKMSADQLRHRMQVEGRYLAERMAHAEQIGEPESGYVSFSHIAAGLGSENSIADEIDQASAQLSRQLEELLAEPARPDQSTMQHMTGLLKDLLNAQSRLFAAHAAEYEEVRRMPNLSTEDKADILRSELSFATYATNSAVQIPAMVDKALDKASVIAASLDTLGQPEEAAQWHATANELKEVQKDISSDFKTAIDQAKLSLVLKQYQDTSSDWKNQGRAFMGQGLRQAGLSGFALGAVRAFTLAGMANHPVAQVFGAGLTTGIAHEVGTQLLATAILEIVGGATRPINSAEVLPAPNKLVSEDGQVRPRNDEEMKKEMDLVNAMRQEHEQSKNANKTGSLPGEAKAWAFFSGVQGARAAITSDMDLTAFQDAGAVTLGSILAGFFMGGTHGADGLNAKMTDQFGRKLHAHTMKEPSDKPTGARVKKAVDVGWAKLNPFETANRKVFENKVAALTAGMGYAKILDPAIDAIPGSSPAMKAGLTGLAAGVQSIMLLSQAWGGFGLGAQVTADKKALATGRAKRALEEGGTAAPAGPRSYERLRTALNNTTDPGREHFTHATKAGTLSRKAEDAYVRLQGVGEMVEALVTDTLEDGPALLAEAGSSVKKAFKGNKVEASSSAQGDTSKK